MTSTRSIRTRLFSRIAALFLTLLILTSTAAGTSPASSLFSFGASASAAFDIQGTVPTRVLKVTSPLMTGSDVKWVQSCLVKWGAKLSIDGKYGTQTANAVRAFQRMYGLTVDGKFGPASTKAMQNWLSKQSSAGNTLTAKALANQILELERQGKIQLYRKHCCGRTGDGATAYDNIRDISLGKAVVKRSSYRDQNLPKAPGGTTTLDTDILRILLDLQKKYSSKTIIVTAIAGSCHNAGSRHYAGKAIDFQIKGKSAVCTKAQGIEVYQYLKSLGYQLRNPFGGTAFENAGHYHIELK